MQKLTFQFEQPQIEINGHVFDILLSDADIFKMAAELELKYSNIQPDEYTSEMIIEAADEVEGYIDSILGEDALGKISGGRPVPIGKAVEILMDVVKVCVDSYAGYITEEYA